MIKGVRCLSPLYTAAWWPAGTTRWAPPSAWPAATASSSWGRQSSGEWPLVVTLLLGMRRMLSSKILFRCTESGAWSHQIPFCKRACRFPGPRDNADITPLKFRSDMTHAMFWWPLITSSSLVTMWGRGWRSSVDKDSWSRVKEAQFSAHPQVTGRLSCPSVWPGTERRKEEE